MAVKFNRVEYLELFCLLQSFIVNAEFGLARMLYKGLYNIKISQIAHIAARGNGQVSKNQGHSGAEAGLG
jgi:hypothetical protein